MSSKSNKKIGKMTLVLLVTITLAVVAFSGCKEQTDASNITIKGSSTVLPIAETAAEQFMAENSDVKVSVSGGGSSVGIKSVLSGEVDIGDASRNAKESDVKNEDGTYKYQHDDGTDITMDDLVDHVVAYDGIAVVVSPAIKTSITGITMDQLYMIYTGEISNWNELGGPDEEIFVNDRASSSGTRASFVELIENSSGNALEDFEEDGGDLAVDKVNQENSDVVLSVSEADNAIGYVGLGYVDDETCPSIAIDGVIPSVDTVKDGSYSISRSLHMYTVGQPTGKVKEFLDYVKGTEGQEIVEDEGFIPII